MSFDASLQDFLEAVTPKVAEQRHHLEELERLRTENGHLQQALASRAMIDQANGIVMALGRCGPDEAFEALVTVSQNSNVPLKSVAAGLVDSASGQEGDGGATFPQSG